jgi:hypothetical protein
LSVWDPNRNSWGPYESYPGGVRHEDIKYLNVGSLEYLALDHIGSEEAQMLMDLALQSTCEEITLHLRELDSLDPSVLRHGFMRHISILYLLDREFYSVLSERLMKLLRSEGFSHTIDPSSKNQTSGDTR